MTTPRPGLLFTFRLIPVIASELARRGHDAVALVGSAGLPEDALRGEITAPLERIVRLVDAAALAQASTEFGLELADRIPPGAYGLSEFLVRSAPDLAAGLSTLCDFGALINPIATFRLVQSADAAQLHYAVRAKRDALGVQLNEYSIAYLVRQLTSVIGKRLPLRHVWFAHSRKRGVEAVERYFGCRVSFGAADCGFAVGREALVWAPRTADPPLYEYLLAQARTQLARLGPDDVVSQVVRVLEVRLSSGDLEISAIASAMATTVRSLQRRLGEAGTTYRDVLGHVRMRRGGELRHGGVSEAAIARALGFSNVRTMRRSLDPHG